MNRRGLLRGILAAGMAPLVVKAGILMPVKKIIVPSYIEAGAWMDGVHLNEAGAAKMAAWFDASDLGSLFQDGAGTIPATQSGQRVKLWKGSQGGIMIAQGNVAVVRSGERMALEFNGLA